MIHRLFFPVSLLCGIGVMCAAIAVGASGIPLQEVLKVPFGQASDPLAVAIVLKLRLPRILTAFLVGGTLAVSGATYQTMFRNPLADPYLLGISAGAGLAVTIAIISGIPWLGQGIGVISSAFVGGAVAVALTFLISSSMGRGASPTVVVLAGVAVAAFASAFQTFLQQRNIMNIQQIYSWMLGSVARTHPRQLVLLAAVVIPCWMLLWASSRRLDVMALGDVEAHSLGLNPARQRLFFVVIATLATATVVSVSGLIGFVGIIIPHSIRLLLGQSHFWLLPGCMLWGGIFLLCADTIGRTAVAPAELPVGVVTAMCGAPFFIVLLRKFGRFA